MSLSYKARPVDLHLVRFAATFRRSNPLRILRAHLTISLTVRILPGFGQLLLPELLELGVALRSLA